MDQSVVSSKWVPRFILAGFCAALAWGIVATRRQHRTLADLERQMSELREAPREGPRVVHELRTVLREHEVVRAAPVPSAENREREEGAREPREMTPEEAQYRADTFVAARDKTLADSYARESPDAEWSGAATSQLRSAYVGPGFEGLSLDSECKATICRVSFRYSDPASAEQWRNLQRSLPWAGATNATVNAETRQGTFYAAREGYDLPAVDPTTIAF